MSWWSKMKPSSRRRWPRYWPPKAIEVDVACNGRVALEKIRAQAYDLILSDLRMPELDGVGLYRELERQHPDLLRRLIVITATAGDLDYQRFLAQIDVPVLEKPFSLLALHAVTHEVLSTGPPTGCTIPRRQCPHRDRRSPVEWFATPRGYVEWVRPAPLGREIP